MRSGRSENEGSVLSSHCRWRRAQLAARGKLQDQPPQFVRERRQRCLCACGQRSRATVRARTTTLARARARSKVERERLVMGWIRVRGAAVRGRQSPQHDAVLAAFQTTRQNRPDTSSISGRLRDWVAGGFATRTKGSHSWDDPQCVQGADEIVLCMPAFKLARVMVVVMCVCARVRACVRAGVRARGAPHWPTWMLVLAAPSLYRAADSSRTASATHTEEPPLDDGAGQCSCSVAPTCVRPATTPRMMPGSWHGMVVEVAPLVGLCGPRHCHD